LNEIARESGTKLESSCRYRASYSEA
jgi:hypothetical protein